jgi:hypothetical protein
MIKQVITAASFSLGGAGVVLVGYLSTTPLAFTHPVAYLPSSTPITRTMEETPATVTLGHAIVMPDVNIFTSLRRPPAPAVSEKLDACSDFRSIGAVFIEPSGATGVRGVRELCATASNP